MTLLQMTLVFVFLISFHFLSLFVVMLFSSWVSKGSWEIACHGCWVVGLGCQVLICLSSEELVLSKTYKSLQLLTIKGPWCLYAVICCRGKVCVLVTKVDEAKLMFVSCGRRCWARRDKMFPFLTHLSARTQTVIWHSNKRHWFIYLSF